MDHHNNHNPTLGCYSTSIDHLPCPGEKATSRMPKLLDPGNVTVSPRDPRVWDKENICRTFSKTSNRIKTRPGYSSQLSGVLQMFFLHGFLISEMNVDDDNAYKHPGKLGIPKLDRLWCSRLVIWDTCSHGKLLISKWGWVKTIQHLLLPYLGEQTYSNQLWKRFDRVPGCLTRSRMIYLFHMATWQTVRCPDVRCPAERRSFRAGARSVRPAPAMARHRISSGWCCGVSHRNLWVSQCFACWWFQLRESWRLGISQWKNWSEKAIGFQVGVSGCHQVTQGLKSHATSRLKIISSSSRPCFSRSLWNGAMGRVASWSFISQNAKNWLSWYPPFWDTAIWNQWIPCHYATLLLHR